MLLYYVYKYAYVRIQVYSTYQYTYKSTIIYNGGTKTPISHLGVLITMNEDRTLFLSQPAYVKEILSEYPPQKRYKSPCEENLFHYQPKEGTEEINPVDRHT